MTLDEVLSGEKKMNRCSMSQNFTSTLESSSIKHFSYAANKNPKKSSCKGKEMNLQQSIFLQVDHFGV